MENSWPWSGKGKQERPCRGLERCRWKSPRESRYPWKDRTFSGKRTERESSPWRFHPEIEVEVDGTTVQAFGSCRPSDQPRHKALHGLTFGHWWPTWSKGVNEGFSKTLEIVGVGYRADPQGKGLKMAGWVFSPHRLSSP